LDVSKTVRIVLVCARESCGVLIGRKREKGTNCAFSGQTHFHFWGGIGGAAGGGRSHASEGSRRATSRGKIAPNIPPTPGGRQRQRGGIGLRVHSRLARASPGKRGGKEGGGFDRRLGCGGRKKNSPSSAHRMRRHAAPLGTSLFASTLIGPLTPEPRNFSPSSVKMPNSSLYSPGGLGGGKGGEVSD
jgi:hypothetical protein